MPDPLSSQDALSHADDVLAATMTHESPRPTSRAERIAGGIGREMVKMSPLGWVQSAKHLTEGQMSNAPGQLASPETTGAANLEALQLLGGAAGTRFPFASSGELGALGGRLKWTPSETATLQHMMESGQFSARQLPGRTPSEIAAKMEDIASQPIKGTYQKGAPIISADQEKIDQLMQMLSSQNMTIPQMAEKLGVSEKSVRRYMSDELNIRAKNAFGSDWSNPERIKQYKDMVAQGWSQEQMAKKLGTHVGTVGKQLAALNRAGIIDYTPAGGTRTPSLPSFNLPGEAAGDPEYEKALSQFLSTQQPRGQ